jgi:glycosyltransferase involved in cell wall biosynthesis
MSDDQGLEILAYLHSFDPGGVERTALRLCAAWQAQGARVKVLMGRETGATRGSAPQLDYVVYSSGIVPTAPFETLWMIRCLWKRVRAARPDVIFCAGNSYTVVAAALRLLLGRSCPPIVAKVSNTLDRRDMPRPGRPFYRLWLRIQGRMIGRCVAIAPGLDREIATLMRVAPGRISIIPDPAISAAEAAGLASAQAAPKVAAEGRLFLGVGRLVRQKRFDLLIDAFARGARPGDRLAIIGEGPCRRRLEARAARRGIEGRLLLPGHVGDLLPWFAHADVLVMSSDYEGLPAVLVEALAAGLPIISTRSSPGVTALLDGGIGRLVAPGDVPALAAALAADLPAQQIDRARARAAAFRIEQAGPAWLELLRCAARPVSGQVRQSRSEAVSGQ